MNCPSIFNDVLGPVMRGPSSSHCAASVRIGKICHDLMDGNIKEVIIQYDPNGSLATTHKSQGSDMGLFAGFLGWDADDPRLPDYQDWIDKQGIRIHIVIEPMQTDHPNTYKISLFNEEEMKEVVAISTGGGMIEVISIDGASLSMMGDFYETLFYVNSEAAVSEIQKIGFEHDHLGFKGGREPFVQVKSQSFLPPQVLSEILALDHVNFIRQINPVLPVLSRKELKVPFQSCAEMLEYNKEKDFELWKLAMIYESARGNLSQEMVYEKMKELLKVMRTSIQEGLKGTSYSDRILGAQSLNFKSGMERGELIQSELLNRIILYVSAMMEMKSSMGTIVAAPTAGSCGTLPGAILGMAETLNLSDDEVIKAMFCAGIIGIFISTHATFAAEVGGCMAECGSASGMAAAGMVTLAGGALDQSLSAASQALQNLLGMICDPIANRVEAPCLGRNITAASNALTCANMALANYDHLVPLDEVIQTMDQVGHRIAHELRCTALGGLSITQTSRDIEAKLAHPDGEESLEKSAMKFKVC